MTGLKNVKKFIPVVIVIIAALAAGSLYLAFAGNSDNSNTAVITLDGNVIREIDLLTAPDETFTVESERGSNVIRVENGTIRVTEASCPDKICVSHGELVSEQLPIVCLPNRLVIALK